MIVLFMVVSFDVLDASIECVSHSFQNVSFFSIIVFGLVVMDFCPFLPVGDTFL